MKKILIFCLLLLTSLFAEESIQLHLSSWPLNADVYIDARPNSFSQNPKYETPVTISLPQDSSQVLITLFKKDYADSSINVKLIPNKQDVFLNVMLKQEYNEKVLQQQKEDLQKRAKKNYGKLSFLAAIPASVATIVNAVILQYHIQKAEDLSDEIDKTLIRQNNHFKSLKDDFQHHTHHATNFKRGTLISAGVTSLFLIIGCTLSF